ncbi:MAG: DUF1848 domain-containing protein [Alphaproteobacteria bacterium]
MNANGQPGRAMIISASYRTDIPAFYGAWFMARLDAGFCRVANPYGLQVYEVPLTPETVDGFVFWTKNPGPFLKHLPAIRNRGFAFVVHTTLNGYPRALEYSAPEPERSIAYMFEIAAAYGPRAGVWRYDPVTVTSLTPLAWHEKNFAALARALEGATDEVVVSFAQIYRKTRRNMAAAARAFGFDWRDPEDGEKRELLARLADLARRSGMRLTLCSQPEYLAPGASPARCIDAARLGEVAGRPIAAVEKGNRPGCLCAASRDIGAYDSCPMGCVYCYAVQNRALARKRFKRHDAKGEFLFPPATNAGGHPKKPAQEPFLWGEASGKR